MLAMLGFAALCPGKASAEILPAGWTWRRPLMFKQAVSDAPGENIAWAEFYANGAQRPDGADFRITTAQRQMMPFKLLQHSKEDDFVRIAFATRGEGPYYVWWGNPKAEPPTAGGGAGTDKPLEIRRGIYLEVYRSLGRPGVALEQTPGAAQFLAGYFVNELALGFNPYGDDRNVLLHYSGQFKIDRPLKPQMAFTVSDVGALEIDGKEVARERGGLRGRVRDSVTVDLGGGWHTVDVRQVNQNQANVAMSVAWKRPGEANYTIMPGPLFAAAARAAPGALEKAGAPVGEGIDFAAEPAAEGFIPPNTYVQRYTFDAHYPESMRPTITWDFGDGQVIAGLKHVNHIYLAPGIYPVTLKVEPGGTHAAGGDELRSTIRITVKDRMIARFPRPPEDPPRALAAVLKEYDPNKLPPAQALLGSLFFENTGDTDNMLAWGRSWLKAEENVPLTSTEDATLREQTENLANVLLTRRQGKDAAEVYRLAAEKPAPFTTRADMLRMEVVLLCDEVDDAEGALRQAQAWEKKTAAEAAAKPAGNVFVQEAVAYAAIAKGDGKLAQSALQAAAGKDRPTLAVLNQRDIRRGVLTRNIENALRTKDFETGWRLVNQWEEEFPDALWDGFTRTLRVKLAAAQGKFLVAAKIALAHARANPEGFYAAELLFRAAENFRQAGQDAQAKTAMDLLTSKYPESPYARNAGG
jgi:PKD repeat protein